MSDCTLDFSIGTDSYRLKANNTGRWIILKGQQVLQDYTHLDSAFAAILGTYEWNGLTPDPELFEAIEATLLNTDTKGD